MNKPGIIGKYVAKYFDEIGQLYWLAIKSLMVIELTHFRAAVVKTIDEKQVLEVTYYKAGSNVTLNYYTNNADDILNELFEVLTYNGDLLLTRHPWTMNYNTDTKRFIKEAPKKEPLKRGRKKGK